MSLKIFIAGIMQGSFREAQLHSQDYRTALVAKLREVLPDANIYDPFAEHGQALAYDEVTGRRVFFGHNLMCREADLVVAFAPEASMGTAIEMWEAYSHGAIVVTISPLEANWAIRFLSHYRFEQVGEFADRLDDATFVSELKARTSIGTHSEKGPRGLLSEEDWAKAPRWPD